MSEAIAYFERNTGYEVQDVVAICVLGMKNAREVAPPEEGVDPYFWSRRFAHKPNRIFTTNNEGDLILACIENEVKFRPDSDHDDEWALNLFTTELAKAKENRL